MSINLSFKRGSQANLNSLIASQKAETGTFYLTTDTNRLYVGADNNIPKLLNQTVQIVDTFSSLSSVEKCVNDFYYIKDTNILCVYTGESIGGNDGWVQINPDTNTDTYVTNVTKPEVSIINDGILVHFEIEQDEYDKFNNSIGKENIPVEFTIPKIGLAEVTGVKVGLDTAIKDSAIQLQTSGVGADTENVITLAGGTNVTLALDNDIISIAAKDTTYTLEQLNTGIQFKNLLTNDIITTINFISDENDSIEIEGSKEGISINHKDYAGTKTVLESENELSAEQVINVVTGITSTQGHINSYEVSKFKMPVDNDTQIQSIALTTAQNNPGALSLSIKDTNNHEITANTDQILYFNVNGSQVSNQGDIEFYTKDDIDNMFKTIDSMTYKGVLDNNELPLQNVQNGDTYKVNIANEYNGILAFTGDLFIAAGEEGDNGFIPSDEIKWTHIPSGGDADTTYDLNTANGQIILKNNIDNNENSFIQFTGQKDISVKTVGDNTILIEHNTSTEEIDYNPTTKTENIDSSSFAAITEIKINDQGHVLGYTSSEFKLPEDKDTTYSASFTKTNNILLLEDGENNSVMKMSFAGDQYIGVSSTGSAIDDGITLNFNHLEYELDENYSEEKTATIDGKRTFSAITKVERDSGGHLDKYTLTTYTLPDDKNETFTLSGETQISDNKATFNLSLKGSSNNDSETLMSVESSTLNIDNGTNTNTIKMNLTWGTF